MTDILGNDEFPKGGPSGGVNDSFLDFGAVECLKGRTLAVILHEITRQ